MAIEVQRMRERLVNLGIAVAEIAHDGESTERKWDGSEEKLFSGYSLPPESPSKRSAYAAEFEESCMPNPPSEPYASAFKRAASSFQDRIADSSESLQCSGVVSCKSKNCNTAGESYNNLDGAAPCMMATPRTPSGTHNLRNLDGRKIDLWQIKAREEPDSGRNTQTEEEGTPPSVKQDEKPVDKQGEDPIKIPSKAELGRVLANMGERNHAAERGLTSHEHSPRNRAAADPHAKSLESEVARRKEQENHKHTMSSVDIISPKFGLALKSRENNLPNFEEGNLNKEQRPGDGRHSNITKAKADNPPSCTFHTCKDSLSSASKVPIEASNLERRENMPHDQLEETDFQAGDSQLIRTLRLFGRCKSVSMNEFLGTLNHAMSYPKPRN